MFLPHIEKTSKYESKIHGSSDFPYIVYYGHIPEFFSIFPMHWHDEMEIIHIIKGNCMITINKNIYHAGTGDIILIMPGMLHAIESKNECECEYFNIVFDIRMLGTDLTDACYIKNLKPYTDGTYTLPNSIPKTTDTFRKITPLLFELENLREDRTPGLELLIKARLLEIFWLLKPLQNISKSNVSDKNYASQIEKMKSLLTLISLNYARPMTINEAAGFCGYSPSYFMKFFKSFTGETFIEYLNTYRIKKSEELLRETDLSVLEISELTGFENHSYFIRTFKKIYGVTPLKYRKAQRNPIPGILPASSVNH